MYKLLWAVKVKFDVLLSFFIKGESQEEGSKAINVVRKVKNLKGWEV